MGVVILGVIASAAWDGGKLIGGWAGPAALNVLTLGIESLKDHIYWRASDSSAVQLAVTFQSRLILSSVFLCGSLVLGGLAPRATASGLIETRSLFIGLGVRGATEQRTDLRAAAFDHHDRSVPSWRAEDSTWQWRRSAAFWISLSMSCIAWSRSSLSTYGTFIS